MSKRKPLNRDEFDAVAILHIKRGDGTPIVSRDEAKALSPREIVDLFRSRIHVDHVVPHAIGGSNHPANLQFLAKPEHAEKTTKRDVPEIAKTKRIAKKQAAFRNRLLAKAGADSVQTDAKPASRMRSRKLTSRSSFPTGRKMQSRKMRSASCSKPR